jgi:hypothetical protein
MDDAKGVRDQPLTAGRVKPAWWIEEAPEVFEGVSSLVRLSLLWRHALHARLVRPDAGDDEITPLTHRLSPGLGAYGLLIILGLFRPVTAVIGLLADRLVLLVPCTHSQAITSPTLILAWASPDERRPCSGKVQQPHGTDQPRPVQASELHQHPHGPPVSLDGKEKVYRV